MKFGRTIVVAMCLSLVPQLASAQSQNIVYACTRLAGGGVTQTYIAPIKRGVPVCNNPKHKGPFQLLDLNAVTSGPQGATGANGKDGTDGKDGKDGAAGAQGVQGATGPQGPQGAAGPQGAQGPEGPDGAKVKGSIRTCARFSEGQGGSSSRQAFCVLEGTSFTFRHLFVDTTDAAEVAFTLFHVPDGTYTLNCDIENACGFFQRFTRASTNVTVSGGAAVDVGAIDLCDTSCVVE